MALLRLLGQELHLPARRRHTRPQQMPKVQQPDAQWRTSDLRDVHGRGAPPSGVLLSHGRLAAPAPSRHRPQSGASFLLLCYCLHLAARFVVNRILHAFALAALSLERVASGPSTDHKQREEKPLSARLHVGRRKMATKFASTWALARHSSLLARKQQRFRELLDRWSASNATRARPGQHRKSGPNQRHLRGDSQWRPPKPGVRLTGEVPENGGSPQGAWCILQQNCPREHQDPVSLLTGDFGWCCRCGARVMKSREKLLKPCVEMPRTPEHVPSIRLLSRGWRPKEERFASWVAEDVHVRGVAEVV